MKRSTILTAQRTAAIVLGTMLLPLLLSFSGLSAGFGEENPKFAVETGEAKSCVNDADCDGVPDADDLCPGGDDSIDSDNDGIPDCADWDGLTALPDAWKCGNNENKVLVCHVPPGNPENANEICVSPNAVPAHLAHGDYLGGCLVVSCGNNGNDCCFPGVLTDNSLTGDGNPGNELSVNLSDDANNQLVLGSDGALYAGPDADADPGNEFNTSLSLNGTTLELADGGGTLNVDLGTLPDAVDDADADPGNELQDLSLAGNTLSLSDDPTPVDLSPYLDNTDQQTLSINGSELSISNGNTVTLPISGGDAVSACTSLSSNDNNFLSKWSDAGIKELCKSEIYENNAGFVRIGDDGTGNIGLGAARLTINADPSHSKLAAINFSIQNGLRRFIFGFDGGNNISIRNLYTNNYPFLIDKNNDDIYFSTKHFIIQGDDPSHVHLRLNNTNSLGTDWFFRSAATSFSGEITQGALTIDPDGVVDDAQRLVIAPDMRVGIGQGFPGARLHVTGQGNTSSTLTGLFENQNGGRIFWMKDDGKVFVGEDVLGTSGGLLHVVSNEPTERGIVVQNKDVSSTAASTINFYLGSGFSGGNAGVGTLGYFGETQRVELRSFNPFRVRTEGIQLKVGNEDNDNKLINIHSPSGTNLVIDAKSNTNGNTHVTFEGARGLLSNVGTSAGGVSTFKNQQENEQFVIETFGPSYSLVPTLANKTLMTSLNHDLYIVPRGANNLHLGNSTNSGSLLTHLFVDNSSARIGIGTTTPTNKLDIDSNTPGASGLTLTGLKNNNPNGEVLSVDDATGEVVLVPQSASEDADWQEVGTTSAPDAITDNIFTEGNVGIGQSSPLARLHVKTPSIQFGSLIGLFESSGGDPRFSVTNGGNVGLGTSTPQGYIDIAGDDSRKYLTLRNNDQGNFKTSIFFESTNPGTGLPSISHKKGVQPWRFDIVGDYLEFASNSPGGTGKDIIFTNGHALKLIAGNGNNGGMLLGETRPNNYSFAGQRFMQIANAPTVEHNIINTSQGTNSRTFLETQSGTLAEVESRTAIRLQVGTAPQTHTFFPDIAGYGFLDFNLANGLRFSQGNNIKMTIEADGNVGIGTTTPSEKLHVAGNVFADGGIFITSDERFKKDIRQLDGVLDKINRLDGVSYTFRKDEFEARGLADGPQLGLVAQNLEEVYPELVKTYADGYKAVNYDGMIPVLLEGLKAQQQEIEALESERQSLREENEVIRSRLDDLEEKMARIISIRGEEAGAVSYQEVHLKDVARIVLNQNVPNPFKEHTSISYFLPEDTKQAELFITDENGRILKKVALQPGEGILEVYASDLSSGVYSYSIVVDGVVKESRRMVLAK